MVPSLFLIVPIAFTVEVVRLLSTGEYKQCLPMLLVMVNYDLLFVVILLRFFTSLNLEDLWKLRIKMFCIAGIIFVNFASIVYVVILNFYAVLLLFFGIPL